MKSSKSKPYLVIMGQTPPPWHGQAVATQMLFQHRWIGFDVCCLRMEFSDEMNEVGRFRWKKISHLFGLTYRACRELSKNPNSILFYPPASANWVPFLRDLFILWFSRKFAKHTVFIFHANGLPEFCKGSRIRNYLAKRIYFGVDVSLEVSLQKIPPHVAFEAQNFAICPCGIDVPNSIEKVEEAAGIFTVLFVGSLQEGKGVLEVIETANILRERSLKKQLRFRIVGKWFSSEFKARVERILEIENLSLCVELVGELIGDQKWRAYNEADLFFFPTHYASEATPIVIMEALGLGLPVLATEWAGIPAMLKGCEAACLLPIHAPLQYADYIEQSIREKNFKRSRYQIARDFYLSRFTSGKFIERVENALAEFSAPDDLTPCVKISIYLADQHPGIDRSFGISRMSEIFISLLSNNTTVELVPIVSKTSQRNSIKQKRVITLPWSTKRKWVRLLTDHLHPILPQLACQANLHYYPKGYLPITTRFLRPSVVTIHDTIVQYDADHYPNWRSRFEYRYWAWMLCHTLKNADKILTVSVSAKNQIQEFIKRYNLPERDITVTYEPCAFEGISQPVNPIKESYVIHLASLEPHKRTSQLIKWWKEAEGEGIALPTLQLIGSIPDDCIEIIETTSKIVKRPFLDNLELIKAYTGARALLLPSEIEGFGLPALEAYYLGTPVCFVSGTSVDEVLSVATTKGGFLLNDRSSMFAALNDVLAMSQNDVRECGLKLREHYSAKIFADKMIQIFTEMHSLKK